jgi:threonine/homoserine/homoserine lactone efflux protein
MMVGIALTLGAVAILAVVGGAALAGLLARFGASFSLISRSFDAIAGLLLAGFSARELLLLT